MALRSGPDQWMSLRAIVLQFLLEYMQGACVCGEEWRDENRNAETGNDKWYFLKKNPDKHILVEALPYNQPEQIRLSISGVQVRINTCNYFQQCLIETVEKKKRSCFFSLLKLNDAAVSNQGVCGVCFQHTYTSSVSFVPSVLAC